MLLFSEAVLCCECIWLSEKHGDIKTAPNSGWGAKTHWKDPCGQNEYHVLQAKWHKNAVGKIGVVMGACYVFSREWYINGMGSPWYGAAGWGLDESVLSIANWLCGGESRLVNTRVGHWFGKAQRKTGLLGYGPKVLADVWANRIRMVNILPLSAGDRKELLDYLQMSLGYQSSREKIDLRVSEGMEIDRVFAHLSSQKRTMDDYIKEWVVK